MNFGALNSKGAVLYFLHADSVPPKNFDRYIVDAINQGSKAGCFQMKFNSYTLVVTIGGVAYSI